MMPETLWNTNLYFMENEATAFFLIVWDKNVRLCSTNSNYSRVLEASSIC